MIKENWGPKSRGHVWAEVMVLFLTRQVEVRGQLLSFWESMTGCDKVKISVEKEPWRCKEKFTGPNFRGAHQRDTLAYMRSSRERKNKFKASVCSYFSTIICCLFCLTNRSSQFYTLFLSPSGFLHVCHQ